MSHVAVAVALIGSALAGPSAASAAPKPKVLASYNDATTRVQIDAGYGWAAWTIDAKSAKRPFPYKAGRLAFRSPSGKIRVRSVKGYFRDFRLVRAAEPGQPPRVSFVGYRCRTVPLTGQPCPVVALDPATGKQIDPSWLSYLVNSRVGDTVVLEDRRLVTVEVNSRYETPQAPVELGSRWCEVTVRDLDGSTAPAPAIPDCSDPSRLLLRGNWLGLLAGQPSLDGVGGSAGAVRVIDLTSTAVGWKQLGKTAYSKGGSATSAGAFVFTGDAALDVVTASSCDVFGDGTCRRYPSELRQWNLAGLATGQVPAEPTQLLTTTATTGYDALVSTDRQLLARELVRVHRKGHPARSVIRVIQVPVALP